MDPVGQSRPTSLPDPGARPIEFLLRLLDLSRGPSSKAPVLASFSPAILERALTSEGAGPLRFLPLSPLLARSLERVLSSPDFSKGAPRIHVSVTRHNDSLEWLFTGKESSAQFRSDLLRSRTEGVALLALETPSAPAPLPPSTGGGEAPGRSEPWFSGRLEDLPQESAEGEGAFKAGSLRLTGGAGGPRGAGPVVVWPAFVPGQTVEFSVRWVASDEGKETSVLSEAPEGREIVFTLDIPWDEAREKGGNARKNVRLMGRFHPKGSIELSSSGMPDSFRRHLLSRKGILEESLRIFPGVTLGLHLGRQNDGGGGEA
ncbi:MAG: hypothetical protein ACP5OP_04000 [Leptospirillia bacterium]